MHLELTMTERIIESILKKKSILFRPPYGEDIEPEIPSQVKPLEESNALWYITVWMKIDPSDWANPGVDTIVSRVIEQVDEERGNILLLHDSWWDRKQTVAALPKIIDTLRSKWYTFVDVGNLTHQTRDDMMPAITGNENFIINLESIAFWIAKGLGWIVSILFTIALYFKSFTLLLFCFFPVLKSFI